MLLPIFSVLCIFHGNYAAVILSEDLPLVNNRPIIGVLSQEQSYYLHGKYPDENYTSYIAASYVKDVEAAGARVVPIMIGKDRAYYEDILSKINGVLFPGGATYFNQSDGYADAGQHIYEIAQELNDNGDYFPIFGTCLGFELLIIIDSGRGEEENRIRCYSYSNIPLDFTDDFRTSKMFKDAPVEIIKLLATEHVTVNAHQFCIVDDNLISHGLTENWRVTSYSDDDNGVKFIASIEHTRYPFYGVQFHPEKSAYEWKLSKNYPSSINAVKSNRYFMDFFVRECRKNTHSFVSAAEENDYVIYNYEPKFTGVLGSAYHQCYLFEPRGTTA
ncbi:gamma-glutamyl hydrolase-like [Plodia interpunctella]|uniref:gamma-glutamyl hydrolase-like n=1 Tax=Plodia interpunctella TaxID=58824 RepID=UPI0023684305|nr:gamma-glutamyl hydrolase-like [Plodia interpunctella]